jgi:hypothetical protein
VTGTQFPVRLGENINVHTVQVRDRKETCVTVVCIFPAVVISPLTEALSRNFDRQKYGIDNI